MQAQKFDLRAVEQDDIEVNAEFADTLVADELFHLPFPIVWYEWEIHPDLTVGALSIETEVGIVTEYFCRVRDHGWGLWMNTILPHVEEVVKGATVLITSRCTEKRIIGASEKLNLRRLERRKPPLFSHTIIEICGLTIHNETGMVVGERRSPRMHWRKGHIRHYRAPDGAVIRKVAIAPMLVGKQSLGVVEHSYKVASTPTHTQNHEGE